MLSSTDGRDDGSMDAESGGPPDNVESAPVLALLPFALLPSAVLRAGETPVDLWLPLADLTEGGRGGEELERLDLALEEDAREEEEVVVLCDSVLS